MLGKTTPEVPIFTTKKWVETFYQSNASYSPNKYIRFKTSQLRNNDLCDFNDVYIVVTDKITAKNPGNDNNVFNRRLALKPFFNCILKINNQLVEYTDDLDIVMPMYNLLHYSKNFR